MMFDFAIDPTWFKDVGLACHFEEMEKYGWATHGNPEGFDEWIQSETAFGRPLELVQPSYSKENKQLTLSTNETTGDLEDIEERVEHNEGESSVA